MSINYDINERIAIANVNDVNKEFAKLASDHIAAIGGMVTSGLAKVRSFEVKAGDQQFVLSKDSSLADWASCSEIAGRSESFELISDYSYAWTTELGNEDNVGPFALMKYAEAQDDEFLSSVLYEAHNYADCAEEGCGIYTAYGYKDGKKFCGEVPFEDADAVPEGKWYTPDTVTTVQEELAGSTFSEIVEACRSLDTLCLTSEDYPNLTIDGNYVEYFLNNPVIGSMDDAEKFAKELAVILRAFSMESQEVRFCTQDSKNLGMIKLDVNADGSFSVAAARM